MTANLSKRACGTRAGLKPAPTSFATAMCFPSGVCGTVVVCECPAACSLGLSAAHDLFISRRAVEESPPDHPFDGVLELGLLIVLDTCELRQEAVLALLGLEIPQQLGAGAS